MLCRRRFFFLNVFVDQPRHYGPVPAIGEHVELPKAPRARSVKS